MFSPDGPMPAEGPANVLRSLALVDPGLRPETLDLARTYDNSWIPPASRDAK